MIQLVGKPKSKVREFLTEITWTQGCYARSAEGDQVDSFSVHACKWCLLGAIQKCYPSHTDRVEVVGKIKKVLGKRKIANFNDSASWRDVERLILMAGI